MDNDIPLPTKHAKEIIYPQLYRMEVGQSFARPVAEYKSLHSTSQYCRKQTGRKFALRKMDEATVRIWRVA